MLPEEGAAARRSKAAGEPGIASSMNRAHGGDDEGRGGSWLIAVDHLEEEICWP